MCDGSLDKNKFELHYMLDIALGQSEYTNGVIFYDPIFDSFNTSPNHLLDRSRVIMDIFPSIQYDEGLETSGLLDKEDRPLDFDIDERVFIQYKESYDILEGTPPTSKSNFYTIRISNRDDRNVETKDIYIYTEYMVPVSGKPSVSLGFVCAGMVEPEPESNATT